MIQEYTEDKDIALKKFSSGRRLLEAILVVVGIFAFYLMVALVSFSPADPSWSQTAWHGQIHNLGGGVGSWFADTLFFTFGVLAYALPPIMLFFCWSAFAQRDRRDYVDFFGLSLRLIGSLALLLTSCGLAALNVDDLYYFASGGVIGSLLSNAILPWFNGIGATLALLCVWASGLTLFTGCSWLTSAEKIGAVVLGCLTFVSNRSRRDDEEDDGGRRSRAAQDHEDDARRFGDDDDPLLRLFAAQKASPDSLLIPSATAIAARQSETAKSETAKSGHSLAWPAVAAYPQGEQPSDDTLSTHPSTGRGAPQVLTGALGASAMSPAAGARVDYPAQDAWAEQALSSALPPTQTDQVLPHYRFELLGPPADSHALAAEDDGPRLGDWQRDLHSPHTPYDFTVAQQNSSAPLTFMPAFSASGNDYNPQVKQGIGPELPRPKPVRIPTRRELASHGIKIPSQQRPLLEERQEEPQAGDAPAAGVDDRQTAAQYSDAPSADDAPKPAFAFPDEAAALDEQHRLAENFSQQQRKRYPSAASAALESDLDDGASPLLRALDNDHRHKTEFVPGKDRGPESGFASAGDDNRGRKSAIAPAAGMDRRHEAGFSAPEARFTPSRHDDERGQSAAYPSDDDSWLEDDAPWHDDNAPPHDNLFCQPALQTPAMDSLSHPFLMRQEQPQQKPSTPLPTIDILTPPPHEEELVDMFALEQTARLVGSTAGRLSRQGESRGHFAEAGHYPFRAGSGPRGASGAHLQSVARSNAVAVGDRGAGAGSDPR